MEDKKKKAADCCTCEAGFKDEIKDLEKQAQKPSKAQHEKKQDELDKAFAKEKK